MVILGTSSSLWVPRSGGLAHMDCLDSPKSVKKVVSWIVTFDELYANQSEFLREVMWWFS